MTKPTTTARVQFALMLLLAAVATAAFWIGLGFGQAWPVGLATAAFAVFVHLGRNRSGTVEAMAGIADERAQQLYTRATSFSGTVLTGVIVGWWLVTAAQGDPNETLSVLAAVGGVSFIAATAALARRS